MAQDPDRAYDKTQLREDGHGQGVHRDYGAHFFRWGFIHHKLVSRETRVLDIGCGQDQPLAKVLSKNMSLVPKSYLGVDINALTKPFKVKWAEYREHFYFDKQWTELQDENRQFDLITCLEVVEHMRPAAVDDVLYGALRLVAPGGKLVLSTPVFNGKAAKNHINEMTIPQLQEIIERAGWTVVKRFGTFASQNEIAKVCKPEELAIVEQLKEYYVGEVIACFLAPLYPDASRNNIWICEPTEPVEAIVHRDTDELTVDDEVDPFS